MKIAALPLILAATLASTSAYAHCTSSKLYAGAGFGADSISDSTYDGATGFQLFGGYCLDFHAHSPRIKTAIEAGYMNSGDFTREQYIRRGQVIVATTQTQSFSGAWASFLGEYKFDPRMHILGRIGVDFGDADGLMGGVGFGINFSKWAQFRAEYVVRDGLDSAQLNWLTEF